MHLFNYLMDGKYQGKSPLEISRRIWEDNIIMDLRKIEWENVDRMHLARDTDQWQDGASCNYVCRY
jgi:hypothetical protein